MSTKEVFISYSSNDRKWADKLHKSLHSAFFPVFYDQEGLTAGDRWNVQLRNELENSNHLVVLWSSNSMTSQWVWEEINAFKAQQNHGLLIFICLDIDNQTNNEYQSIKYLKESGGYPNLDTIEENLWSKVINKVMKSIYEKKGSKPIRRAVFTLTTERLQQLTNVSPHLVNMVQDSYNNRFADWKPFGSDRNIENILDEFLYVDINQKTKEIHTLFHWEDIDWKEKDSKLWDQSDDFLDIFDKETKDLPDERYVLILDPFALNDPLVKERFMWCYDKCFINPKVLIMSLTYSLAVHFESLRKQLRRDAKKFYDNYLNPPVINNYLLANGFVYMIDSSEVKRQLQITLKSPIMYDMTGTSTFTQFTNRS
jgi:hypothetical protein